MTATAKTLNEVYAHLDKVEAYESLLLRGDRTALQIDLLNRKRAEAEKALHESWDRWHEEMRVARLQEF